MRRPAVLPASRAPKSKARGTMIPEHYAMPGLGLNVGNGGPRDGSKIKAHELGHNLSVLHGTKIAVGVDLGKAILADAQWAQKLTMRCSHWSTAGQADFLRFRA